MDDLSFRLYMDDCLRGCRWINVLGECKWMIVSGGLQMDDYIMELQMDYCLRGSAGG